MEAVTSIDRPDVEAYVGRALRRMATEVQPQLYRLLPEDQRTRSADSYDLLRCMTDHVNRIRLAPLNEKRILAAAYRALKLRNRWAHPRSHRPMEVREALPGIDALIALVRAFRGAESDLRALRDALGIPTGEPTLPSDPTESSLGDEASSMTEDASGIDEHEITSKMALRPGTESAYEAAIRIREQAFESAGSVFGADESIWTEGNLGELQSCLLDEKESGLDQFVGRYVQQLGDARTEVVQLAGEVLFVHLWINALSISGPTKRAAVERVLSCRSACTPMPPPIARALDMGLVRTGAWFHQNRWQYIRVVTETALAIHQMPDAKALSLVDDPWRFRDWLMLSTDGAAQRHALLHLLFPDTFEAIVSGADKLKILKYFESKLGKRTTDEDEDQGLYALRRELAPEYGPCFDYYRLPVMELWRGT